MTLVNEGVDAERRDSMPTVSSYLVDDRTPAPAFLHEPSGTDLGDEVMGKEAFTSREWHEQEKRNLWKRVWQMACRENDIPEAGDQLVYDVVGQSVIVVRTAQGDIKAFHNACQHRGTRLVEGAVHDDEIQCPFHAWTWHLDGSLKSIPCRWDFPAVEDEKVALRQVQVGTWNGWVFVNLDPAAGPLEEFLGPQVQDHWKQWPRDRSWKAVHLRKVIPVNWKAALHAFNEVYHTVRVHPEALPYSGDCNAQYDHFGPHSRMVITMGVPSPHLGATDEQDIVDTMIGDAFANIMGEHGESIVIPTVEPGQTAREVLADFMRASLNQSSGVDFTAVSDSEVLDSIAYHVFPNIIPWGGYALPVNHRFLPNGDDHRSCTWEVIMLAALPEGAPLPKDVACRDTDPEKGWAEEPELGYLGVLLDQDIANLVRLQRGMESDGFDGPIFSNYQERNLRNHLIHLTKWVTG